MSFGKDCGIGGREPSSCHASILQIGCTELVNIPGHSLKKVPDSAFARPGTSSVQPIE
jgi:hypothetical protein